jgi:hypothetical protein
VQVVKGEKQMLRKIANVKKSIKKLEIPLDKHKKTKKD